jgi:hypothetical protein
MVALENSTTVNFSLFDLGNRLLGLHPKRPSFGTYNAEP